MTHVAIDVHKNSSTFAWLDPASGEVRRERVLTLRLEFERLLEQLPRPWIVALEATRQAPAVCSWLRAWDAEVHLVDPQTLSILGKLKSAKSDLKDAELMLQALLHDYLPECYLAPPEVMDCRALMRGYKQLTQLSTSLANSLRVIINQAGLDCRFKDLAGKGASELMPALIEQLAPHAGLIARHCWELYLKTEESLLAIQRHIVRTAKAEPVAQALSAHPGIGSIIAMGLVAEIGEVSRFCRDKKLHSYAGVAPRTMQSGEFHATGRLPARCNKRLRYWAVLGAQCAGRSKESSKAKDVYERVRARHGPNAAKMAAARSLLTFAFNVWRHVAPDPAQDFEDEAAVMCPA